LGNLLQDSSGVCGALRTQDGTARHLLRGWSSKLHELHGKDYIWKRSVAQISTVLTVTESDIDVLKQPLQTTIAIDTQEFSEFSVEEKLHVIISVKDFKAIVTHAGITSTTVSALYSYPMSPMLLKYNDEGMTCEFILMTIGDFRGSSATPGLTGIRSGSSRPVAKQPLEASFTRSDAKATASMPPPPRSAAPSIARETARTRTLGPSPPPPQPSLQSNALFFPEEDDDRRWDPVDEEDEEMLAWDASGENVRVYVMLQPELSVDNRNRIQQLRL
jgi:cell cycle checkpoint control protein RAD9A